MSIESAMFAHCSPIRGKIGGEINEQTANICVHLGDVRSSGGVVLIVFL